MIGFLLSSQLIMPISLRYSKYVMSLSYFGMNCLENYSASCRLPSPSALRSEGLCPLTPEEAVLMLAGLGFNRKTHIFLAGAHIYGGQSRLAALTSLYPNLVTKENLLSSSEIEPFLNFSSQVNAFMFFFLFFLMT